MSLSPKNYLVRGLLIGILAGQLLMIPHVIKWINFPIEHVIFAPYSTYENINEYDYLIKNVITKEHKKPVDMLIKIMPIVKIRLEYQKKKARIRIACVAVLASSQSSGQALMSSTNSFIFYPQ